VLPSQGRSFDQSNSFPVLTNPIASILEVKSTSLFTAAHAAHGTESGMATETFKGSISGGRRLNVGPAAIVYILRGI
jgi:hypothetical protein